MTPTCCTPTGPSPKPAANPRECKELRKVGQLDVNVRLMDCGAAGGCNVPNSWLIKEEAGANKGGGGNGAEAIPLPSGFLFADAMK